MSVLVDTRKAIADVLRAELTGVTTVVEHDGAVTLEELKRVAMNAPALMVTCLGVPTSTRTAMQVNGMGNFVVFVVAQDTPTLKRGAIAMALGEAVMAKASHETWNGKAARAPIDLVLNNLFSTALDKTGLALWAVRWRQELVFVEPGASPLADFRTFYGTYDMNKDLPGAVGDPSQDGQELPQ